MQADDDNNANLDTTSSTMNELIFTDHDQLEDIERMCRQAQQPEMIKLVRHPRVTVADIEPLFTSEKALHVKEIHIENCPKITSTDASLAFLIERCPNLERLTFMSSNISREERVPYSVWRQHREELIQALQRHRSSNPLQLLKTNVLLPDKNLLRQCASFCAKLELEHMPRAPCPPYFTKGVLAMNGMYGEVWRYYYEPVIPRLGWTRHYSSEEIVEEFRKYRKVEGAMKLLDTNEVVELEQPEALRPCPAVVLHQQQLLSISEDGFATLLDCDGAISEDTLIEPKWRELLQQMLITEEEVWLSFLHVPGFPAHLFAVRGTSQDEFTLLCPA